MAILQENSLLVLLYIHSVSPPFQKGGTQILKISKRGGEPENKFWGEGNQKGGKIFKNKGGEPNFLSGI